MHGMYSQTDIKRFSIAEPRPCVLLAPLPFHPPAFIPSTSPKHYRVVF